MKDRRVLFINPYEAWLVPVVVVEDPQESERTLIKNRKHRY